MFADSVGSIALPARFDPEDPRGGDWRGDPGARVSAALESLPEGWALEIAAYSNSMPYLDQMGCQEPASNSLEPVPLQPGPR